MLHDAYTYTDGFRNALTAWRLLGTPETGRNMCTTPDCTAERASLIHQPTQLKRKLCAPTGHCGRCLDRFTAEWSSRPSCRCWPGLRVLRGSMQ